MKITIDGIKYNLVEIVEQKVDQEREGAIDAMLDVKGGMAGKHTSRYLAEALYDAGYRKVGEAVSVTELMNFVEANVKEESSLWDLELKLLLEHFDITKKVVK